MVVSVSTSIKRVRDESQLCARGSKHHIPARLTLDPADRFSRGLPANSQLEATQMVGQVPGWDGPEASDRGVQPQLRGAGVRRSGADLDARGPGLAADPPRPL